ncbi:MAG: AMP-binding protein [Pseudomonadota bacterium]
MVIAVDQFPPLHSRLNAIATELGDRPALIAPGEDPLRYDELMGLIDETIGHLRASGLGPDDRIAVVMPGGPCLAAALLAVASGAVCTPLNPQTPDRDWINFFTDFRIAALVLEAGMGSAAETAAAELGLVVIKLQPVSGRGAGRFVLKSGRQRPRSAQSLPLAHHDALVLPTSGTTSRPKAVPLTHINIGRSARNMATAIELTSDDRLLNVLPLHHSYGLISGLITSVSVGAAVICYGAFRIDDFFSAVEEFRPTWLMGVPAIFQAIIAQSEEGRCVAPNASFRLVHSSASPLPKQWITETERLFRAPVIETYGMTEAASQITSNPMPPGRRLLGSVGRAAGPEVRIIDPDGSSLAPGLTGEVVIRGPNITRGYEGADNDHETWTADGWFRTGDLGYLDPDGYLFIVGRLKEFINRGGEKVSPRKIEEAMLEHPDVVDAAAFPVPHPRLGEDVGAAVVLRPLADTSPGELRKFAALGGALSPAQVPRHVAILDAIPKTATGKVQRLHLARSLGPMRNARLDGTQDVGSNFVQHGIEWRLAQIWAEVLGVAHVSSDDDFFDLGGDSLDAVRLSLQLRAEFGVDLDVRALFAAPTISQLADAITVEPGAVGLPNPTPPIPRRGAGDSVLSFSQEHMLACARRFEGLPVYNVPSAFRISGPLDIQALDRAINAVVDRHDSLRTAYLEAEGGFTARILEPGSVVVPVELEDWSIIAVPRRDDFLANLAANEVWARIDLAQPPLFRIRVIGFGEGEAVLMVTFHHLVSDAWSMDLFLEEVSALYAAAVGKGAAMPPAPTRQYSDFVGAQRRFCSSPDAKRSLLFWTDKLLGASPVFPKSADAEHTAGFSTGRLSFSIENEVVTGLRELARAEQATPYMALLTGLKIVLATTSGNWDTCVLTPTANRFLPESGEIIGLVQNHALIRTSITADMTFVQAMAVVREAVLDSQAHEALPFEYLADRVKSGEPAGVRLPTDVCFSLITGYGRTLRLQGTKSRPDFRVPGQGQPVLPADESRLLLTLIETATGIVGTCAYKETFMDSDGVSRVVSDYRHVLEAAIRQPSERLSVLAGAINSRERHA